MLEKLGLDPAFIWEVLWFDMPTMSYIMMFINSYTFSETFMSLNGSTLFYLARYSQVNITVSPSNYCTIIMLVTCSWDYMCIISFRVLIQFLPFMWWFWSLLMAMDGSDLVINVTVHRNNEIISIVMEDVLPSKSLWNDLILAYGCEITVTKLSKLLWLF